MPVPRCWVRYSTSCNSFRPQGLSFRLEIYFKDSRSLLVVFTDRKRRQDLYQRLCLILGRDPADLVTPGPKRSSTFRLSAKVLLGFREDILSTAQRKWQAREISNVRPSYPHLLWTILEYCRTVHLPKCDKSSVWANTK